MMAKKASVWLQRDECKESSQTFAFCDGYFIS